MSIKMFSLGKNGITLFVISAIVNLTISAKIHIVHTFIHKKEKKETEMKKKNNQDRSPYRKKNNY